MYFLLQLNNVVSLNARVRAYALDVATRDESVGFIEIIYLHFSLEPRYYKRVRDDTWRAIFLSLHGPCISCIKLVVIKILMYTSVT